MRVLRDQELRHGERNDAEIGGVRGVAPARGRVEDAAVGILQPGMPDRRRGGGVPDPAFHVAERPAEGRVAAEPVAGELARQLVLGRPAQTERTTDDGRMRSSNWGLLWKRTKF